MAWRGYFLYNRGMTTATIRGGSSFGFVAKWVTGALVALLLGLNMYQSLDQGTDVDPGGDDGCKHEAPTFLTQPASPDTLSFCITNTITGQEFSVVPPAKPVGGLKQP